MPGSYSDFTPMWYRRRASMVEALRWSGEEDDLESLDQWDLSYAYDGERLKVTTVAGVSSCPPGWYIVRHPNGKVTLASPETFTGEFESAFHSNVARP